MEEKNLIVLSDQYLTFVKDQVESLSCRFHHIYVLVRYNPITEISRFLPIKSIRPFRKQSLIDLSNLPENVTVYPIPVYFLPLDREYIALGERYLKNVEKFLHKQKIHGDIIHAHFVWPNGYVATKLREKFKIPCIVTAHGYDIYDLPFRNDTWNQIITTVLNNADLVISVSASNLVFINKLGCRAKVAIIPNAFRNDLFFPMDMGMCRKTLGLAEDKKIILTVGNLVEEKGQKYLISAMAHLKKHRSDLLCVIIGRGALKTDLKNQIQALGLESSVILTGGRSHTELPQWMNACDLFVFPSIRESFGVVQIEAMACGKPVVATINGGSEEVVTLESGLLIPPCDELALAEALESALEKKWNQEKILSRSKKYSMEHISTVLEKQYSSVLNDASFYDA